MENYQNQTRQDMRANRMFNDFFAPMHTNTMLWVTQQDMDGEFQFHMQIGSKLYPEYPIRSHAQAFYQLRKTLGFQASTCNASNITSPQYRESKFVIGIDTEKVLEAGFTSLNTRAGDLLTVKFEYNKPWNGGNINDNRIADLMHIVLHSDHIIEIHDTYLS